MTKGIPNQFDVDLEKRQETAPNEPSTRRSYLRSVREAPKTPLVVRAPKIIKKSGQTVTAFDKGEPVITARKSCNFLLFPTPDTLFVVGYKPDGEIDRTLRYKITTVDLVESVNYGRKQARTYFDGYSKVRLVITDADSKFVVDTTLIS